MTFANHFTEDEIKIFVQDKPLKLINPKKKNGLIIVKTYYAEFAGPGSIVGGCFDQDIQKVIPVGKLSLLDPLSYQERQKGYLIRRQWIRLIKQITDNPIPHERAQVILNQFEHWFDSETVNQVSDEIFALIVGVLPSTINKVRDLVDRL